MKRLTGCLLGLFSAAGSSALSAETSEVVTALPQPLTLEYALDLAREDDHYQLIQARARISEAQSQLQQSTLDSGFRAELELEAAYIEPSPIAPDQTHNDSLATLRLSKSLYDFSGSRQRERAAEIQLEALQDDMQSVIALRKIDIARHFFEVILADLKFAWDNEAMAIAYVRFDADKDRHALQQMSDVDFLESENNYLDTLHARNQSESQQRFSRAMLAEVLNRPGQLPSRLAHPEFEFPVKPLPEFTELLDSLLKQNPQVLLAEQQFESARQALDAETRQFYPRLDAQLELSEYARVIGSSEDLRATINMTIPLYENSGMKAKTARARAQLLQRSAELHRIRTQVRQQALKLWQAINVLTKRRQQLQTTQAFRELRLDRSRALYEMEVKTDLGDSMVAISEIQYKQASNDFELMLAWMQLRYLAGKNELFTAELQE